MLATSGMVDLCSLVTAEALHGLTSQSKSLPSWLFYDAAGTILFERITCLPEYYLTRMERGLLLRHAVEIIDIAAGRERLVLVELGAGTAAKTGILLSEVLRRQHHLVYQPIDVSETALSIAKRNIELGHSGVRVFPQVTDYTSEALKISRTSADRVLMIYLGSSIGNFTPTDRRRLLRKLRDQLLPGDRILIGADLVKDKRTMLPAYDDAGEVTAAFNLNVLTRLNRELGTDFDLKKFRHLAVWNPTESRIEMHLESQVAQQVSIPASDGRADVIIQFAPGETIHTENNYKFTTSKLAAQLVEVGFMAEMVWNDADSLFSLTLAEAFCYVKFELKKTRLDWAVLV